MTLPVKLARMLSGRLSMILRQFLHSDPVAIADVGRTELRACNAGFRG
jgi:hypothetical protein